MRSKEIALRVMRKDQIRFSFRGHIFRLKRMHTSYPASQLADCMRDLASGTRVLISSNDGFSAWEVLNPTPAMRNAMCDPVWHNILSRTIKKQRIAQKGVISSSPHSPKQS